MRFLLLVHSPWSRWDEVPADGMDEDMERHVALIEELDSRGRLVDCSPLAPPEQSVTVRARDGAALSAGNPRGDDEDVLAGYYVIEMPTVEEALKTAARIPDAATSKVVVHPLLDLAPVPTVADSSGPRSGVPYMNDGSGFPRGCTWSSTSPRPRGPRCRSTPAPHASSLVAAGS